MCGLVLNQSRMTAERDNEPVADWGTVTRERLSHRPGSPWKLLIIGHVTVSQAHLSHLSHGDVSMAHTLKGVCRCHTALPGPRGSSHCRTRRKENAPVSGRSPSP